MGTYQRARHGAERQDLWIWMVVVEETDGRRNPQPQPRPQPVNPSIPKFSRHQSLPPPAYVVIIPYILYPIAYA